MEQTNQINSNIWRIDRESNIDKILDTNINKLILVLFTYDLPKLKVFLKRSIAQKFPDCIFCVILVDEPGQNKKYNFIADTGSYIQELRGKELPFAFFYYNSKCVMTISAVEQEVLLETLQKLKTMLDTVQAQNPAQPVQPAQQAQQAQPSTQNQNLANETLRLAQEHQIEKMMQQRKLHELDELQKIQRIKELQEENEASN